LIISLIVSEFNQIQPDQIDLALGYRTFVYISRITGTNFAVKVLFPDILYYIPIEQSIYKQLGKYPLILKYYQKTEYIVARESVPVLVLQFLEAGTLEKNLNTSR
jgi:hypothetical protein